MRLFVYSMREFDELPCFEKFCAKYGIDFDYTTQTPCLENLGLCKGYEVVDIITTVIDRPMLDELYRLGVRCLTTRTIGYDHIDTEYAKQLGIGVAHVSYSPNSVADYTIMLMLMGCRRMKHIMERAAVQDYTLKGKLGREIQDCMVGIIGTGRIGKTLVRHLSGFGCEMLAYDIYESDEVKEHARYVDLDTIYRDCDIITLHAPATEDNYHMIDAGAIEKMKPGVMLINCARGSLVDTDALIDGIESGKIGFAGLDVIEHESGLYYFNRMGEPLHNPKLAVLRSYSNVIVSPHTAFYTDEAVANMAENSILGAISFMKGEENPFLLR
ncbi:MAG: D-isomer specific 2-hydroxyacid dehydrogenase family protein [Lachnospiraceae bacterium]|nr:D-isomer specific 2-hydroxyacid dehydrogenase family protein [Lachnospiraceae bacterium]